MAYEPTIWKNREVERPRTFLEQDNPDGTVTLIPKEGNVIEAGTPIIADNMNKIEQGIKDAHDGIANLDLSELATKQELTTHEADGAAHGIGNKDTLLTTNKSTIVSALNELFTNVSDGKNAVATAITDKGVPSTGSDSFPVLANKIGQIETGGEINGEEVGLYALTGAVEKFDTVAKSVEFNTNDKLPNPATLPTVQPYKSNFSPDGKFFAMVHNASPFLSIYKVVDNIFTKLPNPSVMPTSYANDAIFSPDGKFLSLAGNGPYVSIYKIVGDTFIKLPNPSAMPVFTSTTVSFSPDSKLMAVGHGGTPFWIAYSIEGDVFTKITTPIPHANAEALSFSPDGKFLSMVHGVTPFLTIYKVEGVTFTKLPDPSVMPTSQGRGVVFSNINKFMVTIQNITPFINIYKIEGEIFTKLPNPSALPEANPAHIKFSPDSKLLGVVNTGSTENSMYRVNGDSFTKLVDIGPPIIYPSGGISFSPDGKLVAYSMNSSPYISIYALRNHLKKSEAPLRIGVNDTWVGYAKKKGIAGETIEIAKLWEV